jgi:sortase (surface protein transpeptidase)
VLHRLNMAMANGGGRQGLVYFLTLVAATGGVIAIWLAIASQQSAPQPGVSAAGHISSHGTDQVRNNKELERRTRDKAAAQPVRVPVSASVPSRIDIPAIDVHSAVIPIGKTADGTLAAPRGPNVDKAAWYEESPTPGQNGPSVIEGHIDTGNGPSVFFELGALRPGDTVKVTREDKSVATFAVNAVRSYPTDAAFPTRVVYGGDLGRPTLRLITCSNFDDSTGHYRGNTVVYAHRTAFHHPNRSS